MNRFHLKCSLKHGAALLITVLLLGSWFISFPGHSTPDSGPKVDLSSPYHTVQTHFMLLSPGSSARQKAAGLFEHDPTYRNNAKIEMADKLKDLLTRKGVNIETIPQDPNYIDPTINEHRYILSKKVPEVYLIKKGSEWRYSQQTLEFISQLGKSFKIKKLIYQVLPKSFAKTQILGLKTWQHITLLTFLIMILLAYKIMPWFSMLVLLRFIKCSTGKKTAIKRLLFMLISVLLLKYMLTTAQLVWLETTMSNILDGTYAFIIMCLVYQFVNILLDYIRKNKKSTDFVIHILPLCSIIAKTIIVLVGVIKTLDHLGFRTESLVQALSFSTLGLGLASQDTIKNLFGSLMITMDRPFSVGDEIMSGPIHGKVETIGLRATLVRTKSGSLVYIPNAKLADTHIDNLGQGILRNIELALPINYEIALPILPQFIDGLHAIAKAQPYVAPEKTNIFFDQIDAERIVLNFNISLNTTEGKSAQECKNAIIPLILQLAHELKIPLGKMEHITHSGTPPDTKSIASTPSLKEKQSK